MENANREVQSTFKQYCRNHWEGLLMVFLPLFFVAMMFINDDSTFRCLYLIIIMLVCWTTEVFPLGITGMFPVVALPLMNIMPSDKTCSLYFKDTLVMFIVTLMMSAAMEVNQLHTRIALHICKINKGSVKRLHNTVGVLSYVISFFVPNAVCIALMFPITSAILDVLAMSGVCKRYDDDNPNIPNLMKKPSKIATCFFLTIAYTASIGGTATLISSPTAFVIRKIYEDRFPDSPDKLDFATFWHGIPFAIILSHVTILIMQATHMGLFRKDSADAMAVRETREGQNAVVHMIDDKLDAMGTMSLAQCSTASLIVLMMSLMFSRKPDFFPSWAEALAEKEIEYTSISALIIYLFFALPGQLTFLKCWDERSSAKTPGLLSWKLVNTYVPWDLIFVIGCGGALAEGCRLSGFSRSIGDFLTNLSSLPGPLSLFLTMAFTLVCTNFTTNAAVMSVLTPGIIQLAVKSRYHPLYFIEATRVAGGLPFLLPAATPPNALVGELANISTKEMFLAGLAPTFAALILVFAKTHIVTAFYSDYLKFPDWVIGTQPDYGDT